MSFDPTITTAVTAAIELALNSALDYDPGSRYALARLDGRVLMIESSAPNFRLYIQPRTDRVELHNHFDGEVSTQLRGPLPALLELALSDSSSLAGKGVEVIGSSALLSDLQRIATRLDIDWEEALSQLTGDLIGHQLAERIRTRARWLKARSASAQRLLSEFLTEELRSLPAKAELDDFYRQVDQLQLNGDRLEARLSQYLARRVADKIDSSPHPLGTGSSDSAPADNSANKD